MKSSVDDYIAKQQSPQKEICQALRSIIKEIRPEVTEEMKWGVPTYADGKYYLVALKGHVNMGFSIEGMSDTEISVFKGTGKTMRHIEFKDLSKINKSEIEHWMNLVK